MKVSVALTVENLQRLLRLRVHDVAEYVETAKRKPRRWAARGRNRKPKP